MGIFKQIFAVTAISLSGLPQRAGDAWVTVTGIAGVVAVLVSTLAMATGLTETYIKTGRPDRAIVLRAGSNYESASMLSVADVDRIAAAPGIKIGGAGEPVLSTEVLVSVNLPKVRDGLPAPVSIRGVSAGAFVVRPEVQLAEGRLFRPGLRELVVGRSAQAQFRGLEIGDQVQLQDGPWTVVGSFVSQGDVHESELLGNAPTLMNAYRRTLYSSVTVLLETPAAFADLKATLGLDPTLSVSVVSEPDYYQRQSTDVGTMFYYVSYFVGAIMAAGALFGALNTMYSAVGARSVEIVTLRAMGFNAGSIVVSILAEALALALIGALAGIALAWLFFNGATLSMIGRGGPLDASQVAYQMRVGPIVAGVGLLWACAVAFVGSLGPAIRAARLPVATALRATL